MESRGNGIDYAFGGVNTVSSSLIYGPVPQLAKFLTGFQTQKRSTFANGFNTYILEWSPEFIRISVNILTVNTLLVQYNTPTSSLSNPDDFPQTIVNGSTESVVPRPWNSNPMGPFDQRAFSCWFLDVSVV